MASRLKLTFDLSDRPDLVEALRMLAARERTSQRAIIVDALQAFFSQRQENLILLNAANHAFSEWEMKKTGSMTPFDLIILPFPFTDLSATKQRPCLVLAAADVPSLGMHAHRTLAESRTSETQPNPPGQDCYC